MASHRASLPSPEACNRDVRRSHGRLERKSLCDGGVTPSCVSCIFELRVSGSRNSPSGESMMQDAPVCMQKSIVCQGLPADHVDHASLLSTRSWASGPHQGWCHRGSISTRAHTFPGHWAVPAAGRSISWPWSPLRGPRPGILFLVGQGILWGIPGASGASWGAGEPDKALGAGHRHHCLHQLGNQASQGQPLRGRKCYLQGRPLYHPVTALAPPQLLYLFFFFWLLMGSWFPGQGLNSCPWQWELRVLSTGPPENSLSKFFKKKKNLFCSVFNSAPKSLTQCLPSASPCSHQERHCRAAWVCPRGVVWVEGALCPVGPGVFVPQESEHSSMKPRGLCWLSPVHTGAPSRGGEGSWKAEGRVVHHLWA